MYTHYKNIKRIRKIKGITQEVIAELLGISSPAFSKIETGATNLSISKIEKLAVILNVNVLDIIQGDELELNHAKDIKENWSEIQSLQNLVSEQYNELMCLQSKIISLYEAILR